MYTEIIPGVYDITLVERLGRRYRVYLVESPVPTLVDAGFPDTLKELTAGISAVGITPARLIVTHSDPDHLGGFDGVIEKYDVESWVPATTEMETVRDPDHRYQDHDEIGAFEAVHIPGHTPDSSALVNEEAGYVITGDVVYGSDLRGLPPGYLVLPAPGFTDDPHAADKHLGKLLDYEFDAALVYHGSSVLEDARSKLERYVNYPGAEIAHY